MVTSFTHHEGSKTCRFFRSCLSCRRGSRVEEDSSVNDTNDIQEMVQVTIRARATEAKLRRKATFAQNQHFSSIVSPLAGELFVVSKEVQVRHLDKKEEEEEEKEAFFDAGSGLSRCSSTSRDAFFSAGSRLSHCSSTSSVELYDFPRQTIFHEFSHCEGWPFGLHRKAVLLPPLPKSPSESWTWRKGSQRVKMP